MPAIFFHSTSGYFALNDSGTFFVASPITSIARTHARFSTAFLANASAETPTIEPRKNSASSLMCPSRSLGEVDILDLTKNLGADVWAEAAFCYQIDLPLKYLFECFTNLEQIIVSPSIRSKSDKHINIAVRPSFTARKRTEQAQTFNACGK